MLGKMVLDSSRGEVLDNETCKLVICISICFCRDSVDQEYILSFTCDNHVYLEDINMRQSWLEWC